MRFILILLFFIFTALGNETEPQPKIDSPLSNIDIVNKHLQENYNWKLSKKFNLILTGNTIEESDKLIKNKTYTDFKIEF